MQLLREDNERKANVIDHHLIVLKEKEEENEKITITELNQQLEETKTQLVAKSQKISDLEQQLKKTIILMHDDNAAVNAKQLKIVELTEQLEIAKVEVSNYCKYFILLFSCSSF